MQTSAVALAGATVLAMAGTTEAFAPGFASGRTAVHSAAKGVAATCRQAPGRAASLTGLRMVAVDPVAVCALLRDPGPPPAWDGSGCARSCLCPCGRSDGWGGSVCRHVVWSVVVFLKIGGHVRRTSPSGWRRDRSLAPRTQGRSRRCPSPTPTREQTSARTSPNTSRRTLGT